jgi:hypothetical protein
MKRRAILAGTGITLLSIGGGCLSNLSGNSGISFERVETDVDVDSPPEITENGETIIVEGTVAYGSTDCAQVELAHAEYEQSQERLNLLVSGVDTTSAGGSCNDALDNQGYRVEATRSGGFRNVSVTEHHTQGKIYSSSFEGN